MMHIRNLKVGRKKTKQGVQAQILISDGVTLQPLAKSGFHPGEDVELHVDNGVAVLKLVKKEAVPNSDTYITEAQYRKDSRPVFSGVSPAGFDYIPSFFLAKIRSKKDANYTRHLKEFSDLSSMLESYFIAPRKHLSELYKLARRFYVLSRKTLDKDIKDNAESQIHRIMVILKPGELSCRTKRPKKSNQK